MDIKPRLCKFVIVGLIATLIHIIIASVLIEVHSIKAGGANSLAFVVATVFSYICNSLWSFKSELKQREALRFFLISILGCCLAYLIGNAVESAGVHYLFGILVIVLVIPGVSFVLHNIWTFRR